MWVKLQGRARLGFFQTAACNGSQEQPGHRGYCWATPVAAPRRSVLIKSQSLQPYPAPANSDLGAVRTPINQHVSLRGPALLLCSCRKVRFPRVINYLFNLSCALSGGRVLVGAESSRIPGSSRAKMHKPLVTLCYISTCAARPTGGRNVHIAAGKMSYIMYKEPIKTRVTL